MLKIWPLRFSHCWHSLSQKAQRSQHIPVSDIRILLNLCFQNVGICWDCAAIFKAAWSQFFIRAMPGPQLSPLVHMSRRNHTFLNGSQLRHLQRNCEDGELCYNSENCWNEVEELQNNNAGKQVRLCRVLAVLFLALTLLCIFSRNVLKRTCIL